MSIANYNASPHNHAEILICIQTAGNLLDVDLIEALSKIKRHSRLTIADAGRSVQFRFEMDASPENSQWGFFQPHRRVMGILVLASCSTAMEVALLHETFQKQKEAFSDFIFDARCFIFGIESAFSYQQNKAEVIQFTDVQSWKSSDDDIKGFLTSVFYVLESKRLQMTADKSERPPLLTTPFEKSQPTPNESDYKSYRKKCLGRWKKYLGDISLLSGLKTEALQNYHLACDLLSVDNDPVWFGAALEGLCAASFMELCGSIKSSSGSKSSSQPMNKQVLDPRNLGSSVLFNASAVDVSKLCIKAPEDFVEQYKTAVIHYSRSENMGVVELEACIKATKVISAMNKHIQAAEFLQNAVYIALNVSDEERIKKYSILADLYAKINFNRKSAFYRRVAAMQCVAPHLQQADWKKCYSLLQGTLKGYNLNLLNDSGLPLESLTCAVGWPQVQIRVLQELLFSASKNGKVNVANRFALYLFMRLHSFLSEAEEKEVNCSMLTVGKEDQNSHDEDLSFSPINLYNLPVVKNVEPQPLMEHLQPYVLNQSQSDGVFLFAPSSYQSLQKTNQPIKFKWCVNATSRVEMLLHNPLNHHNLIVSDVQPIFEARDGAEVDNYKLNVDILPGKSVTANMMLLPRKEGSIIIKGYEATVFGIRSRCLFSEMPWISVDCFEIDIVAELPILQRGNACLSPDINKKSRMVILLYRGESRVLEVPFSNIGDIAVSNVEVTASPLSADGLKRHSRSSKHWLSVVCNNVEEQLPVPPGNSLVLPVVMKGDAKLGESESPVCSSQLRIKYSSVGGVENNWCRFTSLHLTASLQTCVDVLSVTISQSLRQGFCIVAVRVSDVSEDDVIIYSTNVTEENVVRSNNKEFEYEEEQLVLARLKPDDTAMIEIETSMLSIHTTLNGTPNKHLGLTQKISDLLSLKWLIKDDASFRSGTLDISSCALDALSITNCVSQPLKWTMRINDSTGNVFTCDVGDVVLLDIVIENTSEVVISLMDVELEIFQDQLNGFREWNMEDSVLSVGCQRQCFYDVHPLDEVSFQCSLIFLLSGSFCVRLKKVPADEMNEMCLQPIDYRYSSPIVNITARDTDDE